MPNEKAAEPLSEEKLGAIDALDVLTALLDYAGITITTDTPEEAEALRVARQVSARILQKAGRR